MIGHDLETKQRAGAVLREGFLQSIQALSGTKCTIFTYEQTELEAEFIGWHTNGQICLVHNLKTPTGEVVPSAHLRASDILYIDIEKSMENDLNSLT